MNQPVRILVIDDEDVIHASIRRILSRFGYEVAGALTAAEGLDMMEQGGYDAVITDLMMPKMNGLEMLAAMKERGLGAPAIMITGYPTIKTAIQALRLGAVDYIPKPFTRLELLNPLQRTLRRLAGVEEEPEPEAPLDPDGEYRFVPPRPGDRYVLPGHAWCRYNRDNTFDVGVEPGFLNLVPPVEFLELPSENDLVEQGYPGVQLRASSEVHGLFMPLSGRVVGVNAELLASPAALTAQTWLIQVLPSRLEEELRLLKRKT
jgi:CheY-like chemotaxis protein/glycine cleavage system H lipoate-binding protein